MHVLPSNFKILQFCGLWRPYEWSSGWKKNLYDTYTIIVVFFVYTFTLSELIEVTIFIENFDDAVNIIFLAFTMLGVCYKVGNIIFKRNEMIILLEILNNGRCRPVEDEEIKIQMKHDKRCR
uniref:Odorant receptor n=1 Tax=Campoletis chlorideae TaxID=219166 RepID=A0A346D4E3_9HYME|nr:odorant receptor [Campoletis chlorideae]